MIYDQSNAFLQDRLNSFHRWLNLFILLLFQSASIIHGGVSHHHSQHLKTEEEFLLNLAPFSSRFMVLASRHSHNCFRLWEFFSPIRSNSWVFSVWFSEGHHFKRFLRSKFSALFSNYSKLMSLRSSPYSSGASFMYSLISSWSLRSRVSNSLKYLHSFSNSYRWFTPLLRSFSILAVVRSRFLFLRYHINLFVVSILPVVRWRPSQVCAISILIFSTRISSMQNPLRVINLNWWSLSIM